MRKFKKTAAMLLSMAMVTTSVSTTSLHAQAKLLSEVKSVTVTNVNNKKLTMEVNKTFTLKTKVTVKGKASKKVSFTSSNAKVAKVSTSGKITAKKVGTAKITVASKFNKKKKVTINVNVTKSKFYPCSDKYTEKDLVFEDEFNGTKLNTKVWNYETHEPGWVNNELQKYVKSDKNVYVKDGNLIIQALKDKKGNYTSGRVNTQNKIDYKYGRFEARLKVPEGKGFLPAFWMMPTDESLYGQWPKCGEIDIMEVLGHDTKTAYSTLHFGEPHKELQGSLKLDKGDFYSQYHTYTCEWEPNAISFYVDGKFVHKESDWFSKKEGFDELTYPAPYDQPFYMILNLAVGGNWPGNPDKTTTFDKKARMVVDYVKVYHKGDKAYKEAEENAAKPEAPVASYKDPDQSGNYVTNGRFEDDSIDFTDDKNWKFLTAGTGKATASIQNKELVIDTKNAGDLDYSIQVIQSYMPMIQGTKYKLSFEARADENRTMITDVSAPECGWIRYLADTKVNLTKEKQKYEFDFEMKKASDPFGRVEFNLGNQGSTAKVYISNVRLEKTGTFEVDNRLPDGNYVINSGFDQGEAKDGTKRMAHWDVTNNCNAVTSVTNEKNVRQFKAVVPDDVKAVDSLILSQSGISIQPNVDYVLSFDAKADKTAVMKAAIGGKEFETTLSDKMKNYKFNFNIDKLVLDGKDKVLSFFLGSKGTIYLDNVRIQTAALITNGDFSDGMTGFEVFADSSISSEVSHIIENQKADTENACEVTIKNTGDQDWKVQLKQNNIKLEKNKWYTFSFDAKCNMDRKIKFAFQRDGSKHNDDWTQYSGDDNNTVSLTDTFQTFSKTFKMKEDTDSETILSFSLGAVDGKQIKTEHKIAIDNIKLVETTDPNENLLKDSSFALGDKTPWGASYYAAGGAKGTVALENGAATFKIENVGEDEWHVQLKQSNLNLEEGCKYMIKLNAKSTLARPIKIGLMDPENGYKWYGGTQVELKENKEQEISIPIDAVSAGTKTGEFSVSMGQILDGKTKLSCPASTVTLYGFSFTKVTK